MKPLKAVALAYYKMPDVLATVGLTRTAIIDFISRLSDTGISWGDDDQLTLVPWSRLRSELADFIEDDDCISPAKGWFRLLPATALVAVDF